MKLRRSETGETIGPALSRWGSRVRIPFVRSVVRSATRSLRRPSRCAGVDCAPRGGVAEWLGRGLQSLVHRFNSGPRLFAQPVQSNSAGA